MSLANFNTFVSNATGKLLEQDLRLGKLLFYNFNENLCTTSTTSRQMTTDMPKQCRFNGNGEKLFDFM